MTSPINSKNKFTQEVELSPSNENSLKNSRPIDPSSEKTHQMALTYLGIGALGACTMIYGSDLIQGVLSALKELPSLIERVEALENKWDTNYIIGGIAFALLGNITLGLINNYNSRNHRP